MATDAGVDSARNNLFAVESFEKGLGEVVLNQISRSSRSGLSMSLNDIEELAKARERGVELISKSFDRLIDLAHIRRRNLITYSGISWVSLGTNCLSRTVPTRWGLKPSAKLGEKSHPFDLSVHPLLAIESALKTNFEKYLDPSLLAFDKRRNFCVNTELRVSFNHETGDEYPKDNFSKLIEIYRSRIDNLWNTIDTAERAVFISHTKSADKHALRVLRRIFEFIATRRQGKESVFIVWNSYLEGVGAPYEEDMGPHARVLNVPFPYQSYVWHLPEHYFSEQGFEFERQGVSQIKAFVDSRFAKSPQ